MWNIYRQFVMACPPSCQHCLLKHCTAMHITALHCNPLHYISVPCIALSFIALHYYVLINKVTDPYHDWPVNHLDLAILMIIILDMKSHMGPLIVCSSGHAVIMTSVTEAGAGRGIRDCSSPQCQPNQTYCTAGKSLLTWCAGLWARAQACHWNRQKK